jgi:gamma-glutamyltranspeptidase/glutathione hydrolase
MEAGVTEGAGTVKAERDVPTAGVRGIEGGGFDVELIDAHDDGVGHGQLVRRAGGPDAPRLVAATDPRADGSAVAG